MPDPVKAETTTIAMSADTSRTSRSGDCSLLGSVYVVHPFLHPTLRPGHHGTTGESPTTGGLPVLATREHLSAGAWAIGVICWPSTTIDPSRVELALGFGSPPSPVAESKLVSRGGCITSALTDASAVEVVGAVLGTVRSSTRPGLGTVAAR
jgi:hypothetical protein